MQRDESNPIRRRNLQLGTVSEPDAFQPIKVIDITIRAGRAVPIDPPTKSDESLFKIQRGDNVVSLTVNTDLDAVGRDAFSELLQSLLDYEIAGVRCAVDISRMRTCTLSLWGTLFAFKSELETRGSELELIVSPEAIPAQLRDRVERIFLAKNTAK